MSREPSITWRGRHRAELADLGRQVLVGRDELVPPRLGVASLTPGEVSGEILGVDCQPAP
jgi:hypothetical protein